MKPILPALTAAITLASAPLMAANNVHDEASLIAAIAAANADASIHHIVFERNAHIFLNAPVIYSGSQALTLIGKGSVIDGSAAGSFELDEDLTAITEDGTLVFNTAGNITLRDLTVENNATRGIVVNVPADALGDDIRITFHKVSVLDSALFGVHIDDNADDFDDGDVGSAIGIDLKVHHSSFVGNGTGAIDFDGFRVDERGEGDITAVFMHTHIDGNGGDGIELDEAGEGDVDTTMFHVTLNDNGFYNEEDLDDGFDIDEADGGDIDVRLFKVEVNDNMDEGLDFDEEGEGDIKLSLNRVTALKNYDEGIKADEEDAGDLNANLKKVHVEASGDDGIQFTELGEGEVDVLLKKVAALDNVKYGIKIEQWFVEDEASSVEDAGEVKVKQVELDGNDKGDEIKTNNVIVE